MDAPGRVSFVATPIGNLADLTRRAEEVLIAADLIACEDTRHSRRLLNHYQIEAKLISLHEHNEASRSAQLLEFLDEGQHIAVISDAGMPGVSDPGQRFLQRCIEHSIPYDVIPGPSAVLSALLGSGLPTTPFYFGGFLPNKSGQRARAIQKALDREETSVFFESPHRILKTLNQLNELDPKRLACVARELTKKFEEFRRGPAKELAAHYTTKPAKGEITLVIAGTDLPKWLFKGEAEEEAKPE